MTLAEFLADLDRLLADGQAAFSSAADSVALEAARVEFLGAAKGRLKNVQKGLGTVLKEDKPAAARELKHAGGEATLESPGFTQDIAMRISSNK